MWYNFHVVFQFFTHGGKKPWAFNLSAIYAEEFCGLKVIQKHPTNADTAEMTQSLLSPLIKMMKNKTTALFLAVSGHWVQTLCLDRACRYRPHPPHLQVFFTITKLTFHHQKNKI